MRPASPRALALAGTLLLLRSRSCVAVLVARGSPCEVKCGNALDSTTAEDVICRQSDAASSAGTVWEACLKCELTSSYSVKQVTGRNSTDLGAGLYNLRYATSHCLFGDSDSDPVGNSPCITSTACGPFRVAVRYRNLSSDVAAYDYCREWSDERLDKCGSCLDSLDHVHFLHNYINILAGACRIKPAAGSTISVGGDIFSDKVVSVSSATPTAGVRHYGPSGPLSLGAIVGLVIGGLLALLVLLGFCVVANGKRKRRAYLTKRQTQRSEWAGPAAGADTFDTPMSQRPLQGHGWHDDSPVSDAVARHQHAHDFSPYSSQYSSPVNAPDGPAHSSWPQEKQMMVMMPNDGSMSGALRPYPSQLHGPYADGGRNDKLDRDLAGGRDAYEMQEGVNSGAGLGHQHHHPPPLPPPPPPPLPPPPPPHPPILGHPGHGRQGLPPSPSWDDVELRPGPSS